MDSGNIISSLHIDILITLLLHLFMDFYGLSTPGCLRNKTAWQKMVTGRPLLCCYQYKSPLQVSSSGVSGSWSPVRDDGRAPNSMWKLHYCSETSVNSSNVTDDDLNCNKFCCQCCIWEMKWTRHTAGAIFIYVHCMFCIFIFCFLFFFLHKPQSSQVGTSHCRTWSPWQPFAGRFNRILASDVGRSHQCPWMCARRGTSQSGEQAH